MSTTSFECPLQPSTGSSTHLQKTRKAANGSFSIFYKIKKLLYQLFSSPPLFKEEYQQREVVFWFSTGYIGSTM
jgi:hypothetical protein